MRGCGKPAPHCSNGEGGRLPPQGAARCGPAAGQGRGGSAPARPGASPGVQSGGRSCRRGGGGLTGFRWGGRGRERGRGGEEEDGGRSVPKTSVAWRGWEVGRAESGLALGEAGGSYTPSLTPSLPTEAPTDKARPCPPRGAPWQQEGSGCVVAVVSPSVGAAPGATGWEQLTRTWAPPARGLRAL